MFNSNPKHVWNRVYAALGLMVGREMLNPGSLREESMKEMAAVLREFVERGAKFEEETPLQRAVMQRRLLTHFHAAAFRHPELMTLLAFEWTMHGAELLEKKPFHLATAKERLFGGHCIQCHSAPNIHSVNSRSGLFHSNKLKRPPEFQPANRAQIDAVALEAAQALTGWVELGKRWKDE